MTAVTRDPELVALRLERWLSDKLGTDIEVVTVEIPSQGYSNETWYVEATERQRGEAMRLVVRCQPALSRVLPETKVLLQWRVMEALKETDVPVPPLVAAEDDAEVLGAPFFVMERVDGRIPPDLPPYNMGGWMVDLLPAERRLVWSNGLAALAGVHAVDRRLVAFLDDPGAGPAGLDQYLGWVEGWYRWAATGRDLPLLETALTSLLEDRPIGADVGLAWGDARPGNLIYGDQFDVAAVLDWEMAALGPPEMDLAWWLFCDRFYSDGFGLPPLDGLPDKVETVAIYEAAAGRPVGNLAYYELLAAFRMAIVVVRSTTDHLAKGLLSPDTTMDSGNPVTQIVAELLGLPIPDMSPEFAKVIEARTRA